MDEILLKVADWINNKEGKIIVGISGHGASGKTTFANSLLKLLGQKDINYVNTDPYIIGSTISKHTVLDYEYHNEVHRYKMTACHPTAHHIAALERDLNMVRNGLNLYTIGNKSTLISSKYKVNIVEGMSVAFIDPNLLDLKIYLYTDGETELSRRGIRDVSERGTDINDLIQSHDERRIQYELFMHPYHMNFDIVIKNSNEDFGVEKCDISFLQSST